MLSGLSIPAGKDCDCLPRDIQPSDIVSAYEVRSGPHRGEINKITVAQKLKEIRAGCRKGKLIDSKGKEIRFYRLSGCWGNPPDNYQEILERQDKELASLRKRYRVIEMTCNPSGEQIARISLPQ
jgi:hypothetical protein